MRIPSLCIVALLLALARPARADDEIERAREHFNKGQVHYALGEFEKAANEYREAYRIRNEPAILYNIAQAMRLLGQSKQAIFYYSQYLTQKPDAPNRTDVEQMVASLKMKLAEEEEADAASRAALAARSKSKGARAPLATAAPAGAPVVPATAPGRAAPQAAVSAPAPRSGMKPARIAGIAALGLGAGAEVLALVFHSSAQSAADALNKKYGASGGYSQADLALNDQRVSKGRMATVAAIGGAALIAAGAVATFAF
jgi:tetratricopeptide (TPR) repeat protein